MLYHSWDENIHDQSQTSLSRTLPNPPSNHNTNTSKSVVVLRLVGRVWCAHAWRYIDWNSGLYVRCRCCVCAAWFRAVQALFLLACLGSLLTSVLIGLVLIRFFDSTGTFKVIAVVNLGTGQIGGGEKGWGVVGRFGDRSMSACHCVLDFYWVWGCVRWRA